MIHRFAPLGVGMVLLGLQWVVLAPPTSPPPKTDSAQGLSIHAWPAATRIRAGAKQQGIDPLEGVGNLTIPAVYPWFEDNNKVWKCTLTLSCPGYQTRNLSGDELKSVQGRWQKLQPAWWLQFGWIGLALGAALSLRPRPQAQSETLPHIGPYPLEGEPLRGSMGQVYKTRDGQGRPLALKLMNPHVSESDEFRQRFLREAAICQGLDHPALVKVYAHGEHEGRLYMVQEWVDGSSLDRLPLPQPPAHVKALLQQMCLGLEVAHEQGIVHRDLKPANILLRADGRAVIADFGLARGARYETITQTEATLGTPAYMPPEQIRGQRSGPQADLYSLGCIGYLLLTGRLPFSHPEPIPLMLMHLNQQPPPTGVEVWDELLLALLAKDPLQRPAGARAVLQALEVLPTNADSGE